MVSKRQRCFTALMILMAISACGSPSTGAADPTRPVVTTAPQPAVRTPPSPGQATQFPPSAGAQSSTPASSSWIVSGEEGVWPSYIPDDIPELKGKIRKVMETKDRIRIFYENLSREQIDEYLRLLKQKGFQLQYRVYVQEGFPDNSAERLKKGDYDDVDITRGVYHMNIGYGEGHIAYDIYTTGFEGAAATAVTITWPDDLVGVVPQPDSCSIISLNPIPPQGYHIACRPGNNDVASNYMQALQDAGFTPKEIMKISDGSILSATYSMKDIEVTLQLGLISVITIRISHITVQKVAWPPELVDIVPPPDKCPIKNVLELGGNNFLISCAGENDRVVPDYINLLIANNFVETNRMKAQSGELVSVSLERGAMKIQLLMSSMNAKNDLSIRISEKP